MSEYKFPCPNCGQMISCDPVCAGTPISCPGCNVSIIVPDESVVSDENTPATAAPTGTIPPAVASEVASTPPPVPLVSPDQTPNPAAVVPPAQRTSRLAIASLVCSLLSPVTCIGWLPGIICGHMAKSRIHRDPLLKGNGLATAGLVIGYLSLVAGVCIAAFWVWTIGTVVKQGVETVQQGLATNHIVVQTQSTTVSNVNEPAEPVEPEMDATKKPADTPQDTPQTETIKSPLSLDVTKVVFPNHPIDGKLRGKDFNLKTTWFRNGDLRLRSEDGMQVDIFRLGATVENRTYEIQPSNDGKTIPRVRVTWTEDGVVQSATFAKGYGLNLQFGPAVNRTMSGKIHLSLPDDSRSCVAGTFEVKLPKQK